MALGNNKHHVKFNISKKKILKTRRKIIKWKSNGREKVFDFRFKKKKKKCKRRDKRRG